MGQFASSRSIVALGQLTETVILGTVRAGFKCILHVFQDHSNSAEKFSVFRGKVHGKKQLMSLLSLNCVVPVFCVCGFECFRSIWHTIALS